jgi:hypothetical protein
MTESLGIRKCRHALHACSTAGEFLAKLEPLVGGDLSAFLRERVPGLDVFSAWLVGSIPAGVATALSDIDILVCVPAATPLRFPRMRGQAGMLFSGEQLARRDALQLGDIVVLAEGIELDVSVITQEGLAALSEQVQRGGSGLTSQQILILGRVLRGWSLTDPSPLHATLASLRESRVLDIHCAVRCLVGAHKHLEDARAALDDVPLLASHLARAAVEKCFEAALAGDGELAVGTKWLRRAAAIAQRPGAQGKTMAALRGQGEPLLFPTDVQGAAMAGAYVEAVQRFFRHVVDLVSRDVAIRIAIRGNAQLRVTPSNLKFQR